VWEQGSLQVNAITEPGGEVVVEVVDADTLSPQPGWRRTTHAIHQARGPQLFGCCGPFQQMRAVLLSQAPTLIQLGQP
jgi:hypothetical protein